MIPQDIAGTCCGQPFSSKGFKPAFGHTADKTIEKIWKWTGQGRHPVVLDIKSCNHNIQSCSPLLSPENQRRYDAIQRIERIDYIADYLLTRMKIKRKKESIVLHLELSMQHTGMK